MIRAYLHRLLQRIFLCYAGYRWLWHVLAALTTVPLVLYGADWAFYLSTRNEALVPLVMFAGISGFFVPFVLSLGLYAWGKRRLGVLVGQAFFIGWLLSSFYKAFTGRIPPEIWPTLGTTDISNQFNFGFWQNGIFWGWPSSHTATAVAGAVALYLLWPNPIARAASLAWAATVCMGAAIGFHWFSDVVAGIILGTVVGVAVAKDKDR